MASGVKVSDEAKSIFEEMKTDKKLRYVIFKIENGLVQIEQMGDRCRCYNEFYEEIVKLGNQCRYLLYDYPAPTKADNTQSLDRLVLVSWCPENSPIKSKMLYASSLDAVKRSFCSLHKTLQATDLDEVDETAILDCVGHAH
ncbi:Cofilin/actin-depolymerizing factor [Nymphon striatum]|nr:Cofilin/actin-depolymerizing factor [Nymphon striatum]